MRSRNYFIPEVKVVGKVSLFPVLSKIIFRKTNWHLGADLGSWQSLTKGSREEILHVCLQEHSVLSFWHCMLSPGLEVATGCKVNLPEEGKKATTNKADCQFPVSTWQEMVHHSVNPLSVPLEYPALLCTLCCAGPPSQPAGCGGKADSALVLSLLLRCWWEPSPGAAALLTAAPSLAFPSCFLLCLIYRKRTAASQSLLSFAIRTMLH